MKKNEIIILIDDSGKLNKNETSCTFGGLFFFEQKDYINFLNKYKNAIKKIKCNYCKHTCNYNCPEIKGNSRLRKKDRLSLVKLIHSQYTFAVFIDNKNVNLDIINTNYSRGRYTDYAQKMIIKKIISFAIENKKIDTNKLLHLKIHIDMSSQKSNGYYDLKDSIYTELVKGIVNYKHEIFYKPILKNGLKIDLGFYDSKKHFGIQSADILANYLHRIYSDSLITLVDITKELSIVSVKLFLP